MVRIMIESDLSATQLGKMMHDMAFELSNETNIQQLLQDTFARKSLATLYKRARAFWKYFEWMKGSYVQSTSSGRRQVVSLRLPFARLQCCANFSSVLH